MQSITKGRKAQSASGSAILIIIITTMIVLYILFLPPQDRAALLSDGTSSGTVLTGTHPNVQKIHKLLLNENIGHIQGTQKDDYEHTIPSFRIGASNEGRILNEVDSIFVRASAFDFESKNISFILDRSATSNVKLSFNIGEEASGRLTILLNGKQLVEKSFEPKTSHFLSLPTDQLKRTNRLTFKTTSPGWQFWKVNEFQLKDIQIVGDVLDDSNAESTQVFILTEEEYDNMERATFRYFVDCTPNEVGKLSIEMNGDLIFNSLGDCGVTNTIELDPKNLYEGENEITFSTEKGIYLVDDITVRTYMEEDSFPIYYFNIPEKYFEEEDEEPACGEIDGVCPEDCDNDLDKDCCLSDRNNFWCDVETEQLNDRCVSFVTENTCERCEAGYEDYRGRPADACEGRCGDDTDDECPAGCSRLLDKDCCFEAGDTYWCDDIPLGRPLSAVCKFGVEPDERAACPNRGYYDESGHRLRATSSTQYDDDDERLRSDYKVTLSMDFPDSDKKDAIILINGREIGIYGEDLDFSQDISDYVMSGTNSIEIRANKDMDITALKVYLEN